MATEPPAAEVRCPNCGAVLAVTSGPDGLSFPPPTPLVTVRVQPGRHVRLECACGFRQPWHGRPRHPQEAETC